jgi:DNA-binding response OmpR family regulator
MKDETAPHRLLVVEDDDLMHIFYKRLFGRHKEEFTCRFEKNAEDALERLRNSPIDTALLDWDLPGISGIELLKAIRTHPKTRDVRVMVVSGRTSTEDQVRALDAGADDYLTKPFEVEILLARLRRLLSR